MTLNAMKCLCRNAQNLLICCNTIFVLMGISICATAAYLKTIINSYGDIPGAPTTSSINIMIGIGAALTFVACLGCMGAQYRKSEGTEKRGFLMLVAYAICMSILLVIEIAVGVAIYVWIGGSVGTMSGKVPEKHQGKVENSLMQAENFINCTYNFCCLNGGPNISIAQFKNHSAICQVKDSGMPFWADTSSKTEPKKCPCSAKEEKLRKGCPLVDSSLSEARCMDYAGFKKAVAETIQERLEPIALAACIIGGVQFLLLISALMNIFWCCGKSDKVQDDADYDDVYY